MTLQEINDRMLRKAAEIGSTLDIVQTNHEG
jgi:3-dehydroquinate dehydratase